MNNVQRFFKRYVYSSVRLFCFFIFVNIALFIALTVISGSQGSHSPTQLLEAITEDLQQSASSYVLSDNTIAKMEQENVWCMMISNESGNVLWNYKLPSELPQHYTLGDVAEMTRWYLQEYPVFVSNQSDELLVIGYPKDSFWKHMWPSWDYNSIVNLPKTVLSVFSINIALIFIIYVIANSKLLKSVKPIVSGIQALSTNEEVYIREKGLLSELAVNINKTSDILQTQSRQLRKRETARANWIAGVSHDIRTPLSMVMGYAGQLENDTQLSEDNRQKATVIVRQSKRMRNLINDLNLASKLEYNMQPLSPERQNLIAVVRQVVVDFINMNIDEKYTIEWQTEEALTSCPAYIDKDLIKRAVSNLIQNSMNHNEQGCYIFVRVIAEDNICTVIVSDDGMGATDEQIEKLNNTPHYMVCDEKTTEQRHGLGLLIVKQIIFAHSGKMLIKHSEYGGFEVDLSLPMTM